MENVLDWSKQDFYQNIKNAFLQGVCSILSLRNRHILMFDILMLALCPALALTLRLERISWWSSFGQTLILFTAVAVMVKLPIFYSFGLYRRYWRYASVNDLMRVIIAVSLSSGVLTVLVLAAQARLSQYGLTVPRTLPIIDGMLTVLAVGGVRFALPGLNHLYRQHGDVVAGQRVMIVGAGEAGTMVIREIRANPQLNMKPVAFVDDDLAKVNSYVQGLPVLGTSHDIPRLLEQFHIQRMIIAIPSAPLGRQQEIIGLCKKSDITTYNLPGIYQLLAGYKTLNRLPQVDIHHLLRREPVETDQTEVAGVLRGSKVLVTGAGGSIGSELCRQIARCNPAEMILLGHGENSIFEINLDLRLAFPDLVFRTAIVDVRDLRSVDSVIEKYRPNLIFHTAAHKHVPFMEDNVEEALTNNVLGTRNVLESAERHGVERFVLISSDKAVNPTSIMGATKRLAELLVQAAAWRTGRPYMAVRFGNVLGSRGSVIPVFQRQIAAGGPLTITHPDMRRYFMIIPEAVQLVLQTAVLGQGREIFVLDMGQPVRILDLATDLIKLSGLKPERDIGIVYSGIRPGEKLYEELFLNSENYQRTKHPKIFVARHDSSLEPEILEQVVLELLSLSQRTQSQNFCEHLSELMLKICFYLDQYQPRSRPPLPGRTTSSRTPTSPLPLYPQPSSSRI